MITEKEECTLLNFLIKTKEKKELSKEELFNASLIIDKIKTKINGELRKIKQNNKRKRERDKTEQKFYKYGFWLLLTAGVVNLILTQI